VNHLHALRLGEALREPIAPDRLLEGAPIAETRLEYQRNDKIFIGAWSCGVGAWRVQYDEWEFCEMLEGACELVADDGQARRFTQGDRFVIEPGFRGVWRVLAPMRKRFVIRCD
jgi:uncharacterized protein